MEVVRPSSAQEAAGALAESAAAKRCIRFRGAGTRSSWGAPVEAVEVELRTEGLSRIVEYNPEDMTLLVQAGTRLSDIHNLLATRGQRLALDPPLKNGGEATIGGTLACGDSGPLRHRYGAPRDLVLGMTVALADGTVAKSGGKVIKNVAGYDLAKLYTGSFGTLGLIAEVALRVHPLPDVHLTAIGSSSDPEALQRATLALSHARLQPEALDLRWAKGSGAVLAGFGGATPIEQAERAIAGMTARGLSTDIEMDDEFLWSEQRQRQRSDDRVTLRVSGLQTDIADIVRFARDTGADAVARGGIGLFFLTSPSWSPEDLVTWVDEARARFPERPVVVLDTPDEVRSKLDVWGRVDEGVGALMRRIKQHFDPDRICNPGIYLAGI